MKEPGLPTPAPLTVVFEGLDGAGKTTQLCLLETALQTRGFSVLTSGVFHTKYGEDVRAQFMDSAKMANTTLRTQLFLLGSAMNQVLEEITPLQVSVLLLDRFVYTTMAYHGGGLELGVDAVEEIYAPVLRRFRPDLVVLLDLPADSIADRKTASDRIENKDREFYERVRVTYTEIVSRISHNVIIDARQPATEIHNHVLSVTLDCLQARLF